MPRLISSLSRLLKLVALSWLTLISLWLFLPFPTIPPDSKGQINYPGGHQEYIQRTLISGQVLHTVQRWSPSFSANSARVPVPVPGSPSQTPQRGHVASPPDECSSLLIDWRLSVDGTAALLGIGRDLRARVNLTDAILKVHVVDDDDDGDDDNLNIEKQEKKNIYIGDEFTVQVDAGDEDHIINMPWFPWTDAVLFHNQMHGFTYNVQLRVVARRDTDTVEIWKAAPLLELELSQKEQARPSEKTLDFAKISSSDRSGGVLASFSFANIYYHHDSSQGAGAAAAAATATTTKSIISDIRVADMQSSELPSKTYRLRSLILVPLYPFSLIAFVLLSEVFVPLLFPVFVPALFAYMIIVFICWAYYHYQHHRRSNYNNSTYIRSPLYDYGVSGPFQDQMGFGEWCSRFWMTRHFYSICCCCCCCGGRARRQNQRNSYHRYWAGEKSGRKVVIWGPVGPVYEE